LEKIKAQVFGEQLRVFVIWMAPGSAIVDSSLLLATTTE
jgi:hypothetical protein